MKASHELLMKVAELGIMRSMEDFLTEQLKPGRLKRRFMEVSIIVDGELRNLYKNDPHFFSDNKEECTVYLEKFGRIMGMGVKAEKKDDIHVASVVAFCLCFLEETKTKYTPKLCEYLKDILEYYERGENINYSDFWKGRKFYEEWEKLNNG